MMASPIGVAWTLAGVVTLGLVVLIWPSGDSPGGASPSRDARVSHAVSPDEPAGGRAGEDQSPVDSATPDAADPPVPDQLSEPGQRLESVPVAPGEVPAGPESPDPDEATQVAAGEAEVPPAEVIPNAVDDGDADFPDEERADAPIAAPAPPEPAIDFTAALAQEIDLYDVPTPVAARLLLREIEEMLGAPLELEGGDTPRLEARLDHAISVRLEQTTVGGILDEVTRRAGLLYSIGPGAITLQAAGGESDTEPISTDAPAVRP
jgi:hypothetical protein